MTAVLYGARGGSSASQLYTINENTAATTAVGNTGYALTALAQHPGTGVMYGMTSNQSPIHTHALVSVNLATAVTTFIGTPAVGVIGDIAFNAAGVLYGLTANFPYRLVTLNLATGASTVVGNLNSLTGVGGMACAFSGTGVLWAALGGINGGELSTVNIATGAATGSGMTYTHQPTNGSFSAASYPPNFSGYWAVANGEPSPCYLTIIDVTSGYITTIGSLPSNFDALAWTGTGGPPPLPPGPILTFDGGPAFPLA